MHSAPTLADARRVLQDWFGYPDFRGEQARVIEAALAGRDVLALMPTGAGKSVCFQIPAELAPGTTLVVSPLISLMSDQVTRLHGLGVPAGALHGALPRADRERTLGAFAAGDLTLLYVAPERFRSPAFLGALKGVRIARLAVDEAHCIVSWGGSFRPAYRALGDVRAGLGCPCTALTATATPAARAEIAERLALVSPVVIASGVDRANLRWEVERLRTRREKDRRLIELVPRVGEGCTLVYAATRRTTDSLADLLRARGVDAVAYHAGVADRERARIQVRFTAGDARVVVATSAFGMGIDRPDVRAVVHYDMPGALEDYVQEAGRAGRDGGPARCVLLYAPGDEKVQRDLLRLAHPSRRILRSVLAILRRRALGADRGAPPARGVGARAPVARHGEGSDRWPAARVRPVEILGAVRALAGPQQLEAALRILAECGLVRAPAGGAGSPEPWAVSPGGSPGGAPLGQDRRALARELANLAAMRAYARSTRCRRARILAHFGETGSPRSCANCDACGRAPTLDALARSPAPRTGPLFVDGVRS
ncbi:MAG TPA: RecQ family ATP-dependent DNA helicase [Longimicrobiales bacterium]|nr:RecQ family ATP-dependent DNA helicase [Longimicrobiales bacterium]